MVIEINVDEYLMIISGNELGLLWHNCTISTLSIKISNSNDYSYIKIYKNNHVAWLLPYEKGSISVIEKKVTLYNN